MSLPDRMAANLTVERGGMQQMVWPKNWHHNGVMSGESLAAIDKASFDWNSTSVSYALIQDTEVYCTGPANTLEWAVSPVSGTPIVTGNSGGVTRARVNPEFPGTCAPPDKGALNLAVAEFA